MFEGSALRGKYGVWKEQTCGNYDKKMSEYRF